MRLTFIIELVTETRKYKARSETRKYWARRETRKYRADRTTNRQSFCNCRITLNVAALRRTAAALSNGRHCCSGLRCAHGCALGCAFRCFFPPLRASRAAGVLFVTGRASFLLESFRLESSTASVANCCSTPPSSSLLNSSSCASAGCSGSASAVRNVFSF